MSEGERRRREYQEAEKQVACLVVGVLAALVLVLAALALLGVAK